MYNAKIIKQYLSGVKGIKEQDNLLLFEVTKENLAEVCVKLYKEYGLPLKTVAAIDDRRKDKTFKIFYVFGVEEENKLIVPFLVIKNSSEFPSMTNQIHELLWYEREIYSFFGLMPTNYPGLQRIILHENWPNNLFPMRKDFRWDNRPKIADEEYKFKIIAGEGIYELPVGPIHAGIIEPGHFRFSVAGEEIVSLEARLGYVHKGSEKLFETLPIDEKIKLSERISGDTSFTHALAFTQSLEKLAEIEVPERANYLRVIFSELERLANHFNDIGFIMMDTSYTFGGASGSRLREVVMRINELLTGSRFLRGVNIIGGVTVDLTDAIKVDLKKQLSALKKDYQEVMEVALDSTSMINRLIGSGILNKQIALDHGVVGIPARGLGIKKDTRKNNPYATYNKLKFNVITEDSGDVYARFMVRVNEVYESISLIEQSLELLSSGKTISSSKAVKLKKNALAVGITEGWRGEIVYFVMTDDKGEITRVSARDPSFLNWAAISYAVEGNVVPDFPLINKSFNLSYSGNDK